MLTEVELLHLPGEVEHWIRFGREAAERIIDRRRRVIAFRPGQVFAFIRWAANEHGTVKSRADILQSQPAGAAVCRVPHVRPGADILLRLSGWPKVEPLLQLIDQAEQVSGDAADCCPDYWRHVHQRLLVGMGAAHYSHARHAAWLKRRSIMA